MFFNERRKPMIVFGVDINKFYKDIQVFGKLPKFCDNLVIKPADNFVLKCIETKFEKTKEGKTDINNDINNNKNKNKNKNKRQLTKEEISQLIQRLTKISPKKKQKKINITHLFEPIKSNKDIININLSNRSPSSNQKLKKINNKNNNINNRRKKKRIYYRNLMNISTLNKRNIETSSVNNLSQLKIDSQNLSMQNNNKNEYVKKWNLPKIIKFDKLPGREKEKPKNPHEFKNLEVSKRNYSPNFNYIYSDNNRYVNFSPNYKSFSKIKFNITRKIIYNHEMMRNSSSNDSYLVSVINKEKKKNKELRLKKLKEKYGKLFEFLNYDIKKNKLRLPLLNKIINNF